MRCKVFTLALASLILWVNAGRVLGEDAPSCAPAVYMGRSASFEIPYEGNSISDRVTREIVRQSFLAAARDQLGLRTRDESLGDVMSGGGANLPFEVSATRDKGVFLEVRRGTGNAANTLLHHKLEVVLSSPVPLQDGGSIVSFDRRAMLEEQEKLSHGKYVEVLRQAGFQGKPNMVKKSAKVPENVENDLQKMTFVSQFSAVRQLHELIRTDGESPERLGGLARGYANLGLLTEFHWHPAHKVFKARSLVYAQRMVSCDPHACRALWHRAYAFALAGFFQPSFDDLKAAEQQWNAGGKIALQRPSWVDLLDAYCHFADAPLNTAAETGPQDNRELAWLLGLDSAKHTHYKVMILRAAMETLRHCPDCYVAADALCEHGGVATGHTATTIPFMVARAKLYPELLDIPGLPKAAAEIAREASEGIEKDFNPLTNAQPVEKESPMRGRLIRALLESDANASAKSAADVQDCGEPSWCCLGRLVSNMTFVHVWRRMFFLDHSLGVPNKEFLKAASPMVEMHPYYHFLATYTHGDPTAKRIAWENLKLPEPDDLDFLEGCMWLEYRKRHLPEADAMLLNAYRQHGDTHRDYYILATNDPDRRNEAWWAGVLCRNNPFSPVGPLLAITTKSKDLESRLGEWEKQALDQPALASAFAIRAMDARDWKDAEKWLKIAAKSSDIEALGALAKVYCRQGKMEDWIATLKDAMDLPDAGLSHARYNSFIAHYYMRQRQWEKALPFAEGAASSGSAWGLDVLADYYEATHDWKNAESIYEQIAERYPTSAMGLYAFRRRTGHGDSEAAARAAIEQFGTRVAVSGDALVYYLKKDMGNAKRVLEYFARDGHPSFALHLALLADDEKDAAGRDKFLDRVKEAKANYTEPKLPEVQDFTCIIALAKLIAEDLAKGGEGNIDLNAAEKLNPEQPFCEDSSNNWRSSPRMAFYYLLGHYLDRHGKSELAVRCWKHCTGITENISDFYRTLSAEELLSRNIPPDGETPAKN